MEEIEKVEELSGQGPKSNPAEARTASYSKHPERGKRNPVQPAFYRHGNINHTTPGKIDMTLKFVYVTHSTIKFDKESNMVLNYEIILSSLTTLIHVHVYDPVT